MTHPFRTRRFVLFAASTAMAAGGVLVPTTAFAATPATPHTVTADGDAGSKANVVDRPGKGGDGKRGNKHPGKGGSPDRVIPPDSGTWQCVTAPCGPPGGGEFTTQEHVTTNPGTWQCVAAPCGPPGGGEFTTQEHVTTNPNDPSLIRTT
ncbi:hypothetical protein [Streptomyces sp. ISL-94]|uniref:hypothetical protein n=1 Tax=Streptomyces sp. ISL-94 TaxID=2819190 RepID=UPI001BE8ED47|nr:hypothetical protein [Streptomyces sp. ISL-94]MBT2480828.1 hypothetical protein [Streptomyces sp. ISL-94]